MTPIIYTALTSTHQKVQRRALRGWALYGVVAVLWGLILAMHYQVVYAAWLPKVGGSLFFWTFFALPPMALSLGVLSRNQQTDEDMSAKEVITIAGVASLIVPVLLIAEAFGRIVSGSSFYPSLNVISHYQTVERAQSHLSVHAPNSEVHRRFAKVLASPSFETLDPVYKEVSGWVEKRDYEQALTMASLFAQLRSTPEFKRASKEKYITGQDMKVWRAILRKDPPVELTTSRLHQEAFLRITGQVGWNREIQLGKD